MKQLFTTLLLISSLITKAQWSNTTNEFYDSLAMPVCTATGDQIFPVVQRSYPDSGYFVIWEDNREGSAYNHTQIYAQKYDKSGNKLWADNGVPVATSTSSLHFNSYTKKHRASDTYRQSNVADFRNFSFTATDSANGFYVTYTIDNAVLVQHLLGNGSPVFPDAGYAMYGTADNPQLIADGNKGFFIGFYSKDTGLAVLCFRDENGTMKFYGGGRADINARQDTAYDYLYPNCRELLVTGDPTVHCDGNFSLYPNLQGGCGVVMTMYKDFVSIGQPWGYTFMAYNELVRVKKDSKVVTIDSVVNPVINFSKDSVMLLYQVRLRTLQHYCGGDVGGGGGAIIVTDYIQTSNGFQRISDNYDYAFYAKGTTLLTDGNINIDVTGVTVKKNGQLYATKVYYRNKEKYDSIPYAYTTGPYYYASTQEGMTPGLDKVNEGDTLFYDATANANSQHPFNFSLVSSKNKIYASAFLEKGSNQYDILLQQLKVERQSPDSFAVVLNTDNKNGIKIAGDNLTGVSQSRIEYNPSYISVDNDGHALFYVIEKVSSVSNAFLRVSPISDGGNLAWGSVGRPVRNIYTNFSVPYVMMSPNDGTAVIAWTGFDNSSSHNLDIFIRHLDNLDVGDYTPPMGKIKLLLTGGGHFDGLKNLSPNYISGLSGKWNIFNYEDNIPVAGLLDNNNLGVVTASAYEYWHGAKIRFYNSQPYLDRNYTIVPQNGPVLPQPVRLYFSNEEMDALKAADPSITGPEMLQVVKQPSTSADAPSAFTHTTEEVINPTSWGVVDGGYYLEINVSGFSNFFIQKINGPLPVTWANVNAQWKDNTDAIVSWKIGVQANVKKYNVQHSLDGTQFMNVCEVAANNSDSYSCIVPAGQNRVHYYRILQTDNDGGTSLSKVVVLSSQANQAMNIFPNPVSSEIQMAGLHHYEEYILSDITGRIITRQKIIQLNVIPVSFLHAGTYILKLINNTEIKSFKFIKK